MSLSIVDCVVREERSDFRGHLEDVGVVGFATFLCFFLGLACRHF